MTQREMNEAEWRDPANWHGGWLGIYKSERDTRSWVPKRRPVMGWTVNMAHPLGRVIGYGLLLILARAAVGVWRR
jgi:uncharacterized membrane protein